MLGQLHKATNWNIMHNLLIVLHRWAWRQDENFTTEVFAHLLNGLLRFDSRAGIKILTWLTDSRISLDNSDATTLSFTMQHPTELGRPDVAIRGIDKLIFIESKIDSRQGIKQLLNYHNELIREQKTNTTLQTALVFLTRYPEEVDQQLSDNVISKRWYEVAVALQSMVSNNFVNHDENLYLIKQFVDFLRLRNITMERVSWELKNGITALMHLRTMLQEAIRAIGYVVTSSKSPLNLGHYISDNKPKGTKKNLAYVGVTLENPTILQFETWDYVPKNAPEIIGFGKLKSNELKWVNELDLESESVHFFALSQVNQLQTIEKFLSLSMKGMAKLEKLTT
jgi:hypothetical protein